MQIGKVEFMLNGRRLIISGIVLENDTTKVILAHEYDVDNGVYNGVIEILQADLVGSGLQLWV